MPKAPGLPKIVLAPYSVPTFNNPSVANGGGIAPITIENLSSSVSVGQPFTIGHVFKQGALKVSDSLVGKIAGQPDLALQVDAKATWPDGSLRHAYISGVMPSIGAKEKITAQLTRSTAVRDNTPVSAATAAASGINAKATIIIDGVVYTAEADDALNSGVGSKLRMAGPVCTEYNLTVPLKTAEGVQHRVLRAIFDVRYYSANKAKVDIALENGLFYYPAGDNQPAYIRDVTYDVELSVGGAVFYSKAGLVHWAASVWMESAWFGGASTLHIRFDRTYLQDTKMVPNYDPSTAMSEANIAARYGTPFKVEPMSNGDMYPHMASSGAHEDIAIHPRWCAEWIVSQDPRVKQRALENAKAGGSWETHMRDDTGGPSTGNPIDVLHLPRASYITGLSDTINYETELYEHVNFDRVGARAAGFSIDVPHHPALSVIPYMLTGDRFYEDEMLFWANFITWNPHPDYREGHRGLFKAEPQIRGQAWSFRTVAYCASLLPDAHPQKPFHHYVLGENFAWYNAIYPDNPNSSPMGLFDHVGASGEGPGITKPWMDDFVTQSLNVARDLGFSGATKFLTWKAKFPVGRLTAPGVCWITAAEYMYRWRETDESPSYTSFAEAYDGTARARFPEILGKVCGSLEMAQALGKELAGDMSNNSNNAMGYGANMQPAIAASVDIGYPGSQAAWNQFQQRVVKPNYAADGMQFNIVPREALTVDPEPEPETPEEPSQNVGQLQFFGGAFASVPMSAGFILQDQEEVPVVTSVTLTPASTIRAGGGTLQFFAQVNGINNPSQAVTYSASGGNTISANGLLTVPSAGPLIQIITVTATSAQDPDFEASAIVTIPAESFVVTELEALEPATIQRYTISGSIRLVLNFIDTPAPPERTIVLGGRSRTITSG